MDLIDRSKLPQWDGMALDALRVVNAVQNAPKVDAVPVEWIMDYMARSEHDSLALMLAEWKMEGR